MANEYGIVTTVDSTGAAVGAREFKRSITDIIQSSAKGIKSIDSLRGSFRELQTRMTSTTTTLRQTMRAMSSEVGKSGTAISGGFLRASRSMTNSAGNIERQTGRTVAAIKQFSTEATAVNNQLANSLQRLPNVQARVTNSIHANNTKSSKSFDMLGASVARLQPLLLAAFAGFGVGAMVKQIASFDQSIAQIRALMGPQALQKDIDAVSAKARELGATTVFSGTDAAGAMAELVRAGFNTEQAMTAAGAALDLAAADSLDMATAAGITANILASFAMSADQATHASDVLAYAANASQTDVQGVGEAMKFVGTVAKATGVTLEDSAAAIGTLSNAGLEASMAGTGLRSVLAGIVGPTNNAKKAFDALGLNYTKVASTLREKDGLVKSIEMFADAQKRLGNDTEFAAKMITIFGERGGPAILALTSKVDNLKQLADGMKNVDGVARQMADTMTDSLVGAWKELESAAEELMLQLGDAGLKGLLRGTAEALGAFGRGLAGMSEETGKASKMMEGFNAMGTALRDNLNLVKLTIITLAGVIVGRLVGAMVLQMRTTIAATMENVRYQMTLAAMAGVTRTTAIATTAATVATNGLRVAMAALGGPVGLIITLATSAAAAVMLFGDNAESARDKVQALGSELDTLATKWTTATEKQRGYILLDTQDSMAKNAAGLAEINKQLAEADAARSALAKLGPARAPTVISGGTMSGAGMMDSRQMDREKLRSQGLGDKEYRDLQYAREEALKQQTEYMTTINQMKSGQLGVQTAIADTTTEIKTNTVAVEENAETTKAAQKELRQFQQAAESVMKSANPLAAAQKEYNENLATLERMAGMSSDALEKLGYTHDQVRAATAALGTEWAKQQKELDPLYKKYDDLRKAMESAAKSARPAATAQEEYNKRVAEANELLAMSDTQLLASGVTRDQVTQGIKDMTTELEENTKKAATNGKQAETWETMWKRAIERIDDSFVDLWKSAFSGGKDFAKGIKDTIKQMLAEIAHANVTKPLTNWMSQLVGGATGGGATGTTGGLGNFMGNGNGLMKTISSGLSNIFKSAATSASNGTGWFSGLWSGITGAGKGAMSSMGSLFGAGGAGSTATMSNFTNALRGFTGLWSSSASSVAGAGTMAGFGNNVAGFAASGASTGAGSAAAGGVASAGMAVPIIGAIIAGMMANDKFFSEGWRIQGQESDITKSLFKSTLKGNIFGGVLGTMSAGIGLADKGLRGLGINDRMASLISGSSLWTRAFGRGAPKITEQGLDGTLGLGGYDGNQWANIKQKGGWFRSDKKSTQTAALDPQIQTYINGTTSAVRNMIKTISEESNLEAAKGLKNLSVTMGKLELDKDDSEKAQQQIEAYAAQLTEDLAKAALNTLKFGSIASDTTSDASQADRLGLVSGLLTMLSTDTAKSATDAYNDSLKSSMQLYREQSVKLTEVMGKYDGTVQSLTDLTEATASLKDTQLTLMVAFKQLADYGKSLFGGTQQSIRESLMTQDQLYTVRQGQIQDLMQQMRTETDPDKLKSMADQINSLTNEAYGMLDEEQKRAMAGGFLSFLDEAEALLRDRAEKGYDTVAGEAGGLNDAVSERLNQAATQQVQAANVFLQAVQTFAASVGSGAISGGGATGNLRYNEI